MDTEAAIEQWRAVAAAWTFCQICREHKRDIATELGRSGEKPATPVELLARLRTLTKQVAAAAESVGLDSSPLWDFGTSRMTENGTSAITLLGRLTAKLATSAAIKAGNSRPQDDQKLVTLDDFAMGLSLARKTLENEGDLPEPTLPSAGSNPARYGLDALLRWAATKKKWAKRVAGYQVSSREN